MARNSKAFFLAIFASDKDALAGIEVRVRFAQHDAARRRGDVKVVDPDRRVLRLVKSMRLAVSTELIHA